MKNEKNKVDFLEIHIENLCGCSREKNPNFCVYQPFLDGLDFTPDVGNGQKRGEVFTPRFVVDKMVVLSGMLPEKAVYNYDYSGSTETLRKHIGKRVFEPAVGTANFAATILWHKLEYANYLTSNGKQDDDDENPEKINLVRQRKTVSQLRRYQAYTLVALASIYINDIDAGNLQTSKWRFLRDSEINTEENIKFWVDNINKSTNQELDIIDLEEMVRSSISLAGKNWGTWDKDRGVLDVLYEVHTGKTPPEWLRKAWKMVMDENAKLFNGIVLEDTIEEGFIVPGYKNIIWKFWYFTYDKDRIIAASKPVPLYRQILESKLENLNEKSNEIYQRGVFGGVEDGMLDMEFEGVSSHSFANADDEKSYKDIGREIRKIKDLLQTVPPYGQVEFLDIIKGDLSNERK